jgi:hypothetical protein
LFGYQGSFFCFKRIGAAKVGLEISETKSGFRFQKPL